MTPRATGRHQPHEGGPSPPAQGPATGGPAGDGTHPHWQLVRPRTRWPRGQLPGVLPASPGSGTLPPDLHVSLLGKRPPQPWGPGLSCLWMQRACPSAPRAQRRQVDRAAPPVTSSVRVPTHHTPPQRKGVLVPTGPGTSVPNRRDCPQPARLSPTSASVPNQSVCP